MARYQDDDAYSAVCSGCGNKHGATPSVVNVWHKCTSCGAWYCPDCADRLESAGMLSSGKICRCGGTTKKSR